MPGVNPASFLVRLVPANDATPTRAESGTVFDGVFQRMPIEAGSQGPDLDASLAHVAEYKKLGISMLEIAPALFGRGIDDLDGILKAINSTR